MCVKKSICGVFPLVEKSLHVTRTPICLKKCGPEIFDSQKRHRAEPIEVTAQILLKELFVTCYFTAATN